MPRRPSRTLEVELRAAIRQTLIEHALRHPNLTLGELVALPGDHGKTAATITVAELRRAKAGRATPKVRQAARVAGGRANPRNVETRTEKGRKRYDAAMLKALRGSADPMKAPELRAVVGGTAMQARAALNRLIDAGSVTYTGKAAATRYRANSHA